MNAGDTICAIATPPGEGGIGIIRISGEKALDIASRVFAGAGGRTVRDYSTHTLHHGELRAPDGKRLDEVLVAVMKAPRSYTCEDVVEFHCHGGPLILRLGLEALILSGARLAEPGEFTKRAFLNGRLDLAQAEAVMDLIAARTDTGLRVALEQLRGALSEELGRLREGLVRLLVEVEAGIDFTDEDITFISPQALAQGVTAVQDRIGRLIRTAEEGRIVREGVTAALVGRPNVGKSSLMNALAKADRAIVTPIPGTTRDVLEEFVNVRGIPVRLLDTAGLRATVDVVEREGVRRAHDALARAELVLAVLDGNEPLGAEDRQLLDLTRGKATILVVNKSDLPPRLDVHHLKGLTQEDRIVWTSATGGAGLEELRDAIRDAVLKQGPEPSEGVLITHLRHRGALERAHAALAQVRLSVERRMAAEFIAVDLRGAVNAIGEIIGETTTDDILDRIFREFCIGK
ncbi:MAG: tRNA uridine-5-carboxymethylaminomethyl(34) synthesis GTPase MnmE [Nitrospirae bacterium]|nr:MAG: tRNA uridine-5-carboxymethylaminomethyl(34) synthesis GTPase MnmE [Nitrospirota bacterium]